MPKLHLPSDDYSHDAHMTKTLLAALVVVVFSAGCATSSKITLTGGAEIAAVAATSVVPASTRVWVLTPKVVFEDTLTEVPLDSFGYGGPALVKALTDKAISTLKAKSIQDVAYVSDGNLSAEQRDLAEQASASANHLIRVNPDPQAIHYIQGLASTNESVAVLAQYVRVKVGPHGTWNPNSGAITSGASSSYFRAALLDCQTGRLLWENSVLLRELPVPNSGNFNKVLPLLYSTLNPQNENKP